MSFCKFVLHTLLLFFSPEFSLRSSIPHRRSFCALSLEGSTFSLASFDSFRVAFTLLLCFVMTDCFVAPSSCSTTTNPEQRQRRRASQAPETILRDSHIPRRIQSRVRIDNSTSLASSYRPSFLDWALVRFK